MSKAADDHFQATLLVELDHLDESIDRLSSLWGRAINHGGVNRELTSRMKRKVGVLKAGRRDLEKIATGEAE